MGLFAQRERKDVLIGLLWHDSTRWNQVGLGVAPLPGGRQAFRIELTEIRNFCEHANNRRSWRLADDNGVCQDLPAVGVINRDPELIPPPSDGPIQIRRLGSGKFQFDRHPPSIQQAQMELYPDIIAGLNGATIAQADFLYLSFGVINHHYVRTA